MLEKEKGRREFDIREYASPMLYVHYAIQREEPRYSRNRDKFPPGMHQQCKHKQRRKLYPYLICKFDTRPLNVDFLFVYAKFDSNNIRKVLHNKIIILERTYVTELFLLFA